MLQLQRMPTIIWLVIKCRMGWVPAIKFDHGLYKSLVRTCPASTVPPGDHDPEVEFDYEPTFDGILGTYDPVTKKISIDVFEIFVISADDHRVKNLQDFIDLYDVKLTQVLAHEGGHWHLDKRMGKLAMFERYLINGVLMFLGSMIILLLGLTAVLIAGFLSSLSALVAPAYVATVIEYGLVAVAFWYLYDLAQLIIAIGKDISLMLTHKFCYHESFAREFEKNVEITEDWQRVVTIEME